MNRRFCILTAPRSGSSWLIKSLSHMHGLYNAHEHYVDQLRSAADISELQLQDNLIDEETHSNECKTCNSSVGPKKKIIHSKQNANHKHIVELLEHCPDCRKDFLRQLVFARYMR